MKKNVCIKSVFVSVSVAIIILLTTYCKKEEKLVTTPVLSVITIEALAENYAKTKCKITSDGGGEIIESGVCWGLKENPTIIDSKTSDGKETGTFISTITGLTAGTTYHVRGYATNPAGTSYSAGITFSTKAALAIITTSPISAVSSTTATSGGNISNDGGGSIIARGVCWGTTVNPTISGSKSTDGTGTGSFISNITGLTAGAIYHVRSYATNSLGTSYGSDITFTTLALLPAVTTIPISEISSSTAATGGNVTNDGGAIVISRGVCWNTTGNPTVLDNKSNDGSGTGNFASLIEGLLPNTNYYVRAFATNSIGTTYGNEFTFTTLTSVPLDGLVAYYPFNGNADDKSVNANNGIVVGASLTTDRNGVVNSAYYFNGTNNYVKVTGDIPVTNLFTISFWAYSENAIGYSNILSDGSSGTGGADFLINFRGSSIGIRADKRAPLNYEDHSPASLSDLDIVNKWVHVVWVMNPTESKIYLNAVLIATINEAGTNEGYHDDFSFIGARQVWGSPDHFFKGKLDGIMIYNRALSDSEINTIYGLSDTRDD